MARKLTYKDSGVDVQAADGFVKAIAPMVRGTYGPSVLADLGGFAGLFDLSGGQVGGEVLFRRRYHCPALVACTDGVGTKLKVAFLMDRHDTVGIDLVAMSVNDLIVCGADPLFFLDYIVTDRLDADRMVQVVKGITEGCRQAGCSLLGGETAEHPGCFPENEYDLAGFAVGLVERNRAIDGSRIETGDRIIGVASSGLHSNGYSLVRKLFLEQEKMTVDTPVDELGCTLGEELLRPTRIYCNAMRSVLNSYRVKHVVKGAVHVTGGGFWENIPRVLPKGITARIERGSWTIPPIFELIQRLGGIDDREMFGTFNMGLGLVLFVPPYYADAVLRRVTAQGHTAWFVGEVREGKRAVTVVK